ncbi:putative immunoglobulin-like domain containing protein [Namao virus]|nr:putative immunoglobulin-like domain containing protein [Namao virus]
MHYNIILAWIVAVVIHLNQSFSYKTIVANSGDDVKLTCDLFYNNNQSIAQLIWKFNNMTLCAFVLTKNNVRYYFNHRYYLETESNKQITLTVLNVSQVDSGQYQCFINDTYNNTLYNDMKLLNVLSSVFCKKYCDMVIVVYGQFTTKILNFAKTVIDQLNLTNTKIGFYQTEQSDIRFYNKDLVFFDSNVFNISYINHAVKSDLAPFEMLSQSRHIVPKICLIILRKNPYPGEIRRMCGADFAAFVVRVNPRDQSPPPSELNANFYVSARYKNKTVVHQIAYDLCKSMSHYVVSTAQTDLISPESSFGVSAMLFMTIVCMWCFCSHNAKIFRIYVANQWRVKTASLRWRSRERRKESETESVPEFL